jgi:hypothetical protein
LMAETPAQWLPDPQSLERQRYWDGATWTERVRDNAPLFDFDASTDFFASNDVFAPEPVVEPRAPIIHLEPSSLSGPEPTTSTRASFFDTPATVAPVQFDAANHAAPAPQVPAAAFVTPRPKQPVHAPAIPVFSTWIVLVPLALVLSVFGHANPSATAYFMGSILASTGFIALIFGRPGWARIGSRTKAIVPLLLGGLLIAGASYLPTSVISAPSLIAAPPSPTSEQQQEVLGGWVEIDPRFGNPNVYQATTEAVTAMCLNDFTSQTPDQGIRNIVKSVDFMDSSQGVTAEQAVRMLDVVRSKFCGYPGDRADETEVLWSVEGVKAAIYRFAGSIGAGSLFS